MTSTDKIAFAVAAEVGFECYCLFPSRTHPGPYPPEYCFKKDDAGCGGPPLYGTAAGQNPCYEVPLGYYQLCIVIDNGMFIINGVLKFDLNDPSSMDAIKVEFADLGQLADKIENKLYNKYKKAKPGFL